jgi:hypothetical protein
MLSNAGGDRASQRFTALRRRDVAGRAGKQRYAKPRFQLPIGVAERRLRRAELGGRSRKTPLLCEWITMMGSWPLKRCR